MLVKDCVMQSVDLIIYSMSILIEFMYIDSNVSKQICFDTYLVREPSLFILLRQQAV